MNLTAIIPTLNEEQNIKEAIDSVSFADEVLVIDSFSTDGTVEIAKELKAKVIEYKFDNFSAQKNRAIEKASGKWILLLDADERISKELREEIITLLNSNVVHDAYWVFRKNSFLGKEVRFSGWQNDKVIRLFQKEHCRYNNKPVHEEIETNGTIGYLINKLNHNTFKNRNDYIRKLNLYGELQAHELFKKHIRATLFHLYLKPGFRFLKHYIVKQGFRDGYTGFTIAKLQMYGVYIRYKKLKQLYSRSKKV